MENLNQFGRTSIAVADVYNALMSLDASGTPMMIELREAIDALHRLASEKQRNHSNSGSGYSIEDYEVALEAVNLAATSVRKPAHGSDSFMEVVLGPIRSALTDKIQERD